MNKFDLTIDDKLKYFAQYLGCDILIFDGDSPVSHYLEGIDYCNKKIIAERISHESSIIKLHLTSLLHLKDSDAIAISQFYYKSENRIASIEHGKNEIKLDSDKWRYSLYNDYLKSRGYALGYIKYVGGEYKEYSADELVKYGWIELKK